MKMYLMMSKKKNHLYEDSIEKSVPWEILSSLDKPLDDGPGDGPFYPTLTLMIEILIKSNVLA